MSKSFGRRYWAASYGPRYGDSTATYVALAPLRDDSPLHPEVLVQDACERAADWERAELPGYCDGVHTDNEPESDCAFCSPDIVESGAYAYSACDLFTLAELREHRHDLAMGRVVVVTR